MNTNYIQVEWKRNIIKIPKHVSKKLMQIDGDLTVAVVKKIYQKQIESGKYDHLGLRIQDGKPVVGEPVIPRASQGRFSQKNRHGYEMVYKDRPKVLQTFSFDAPDWGDWSNGSHTVEWDREVYEREFISPKLIRIHTEVLAQDVKASEPRWLIKFSLENVLSPNEIEFLDDLLFDLNLLQENVGACDVFSSTATRSDFLKTIFVNWEILPPGERNVQIERILGANTNVTPREKAAFEERYDFLMGYCPSEMVIGTSGFIRYFGAKFADDFIVFENIKYGNAVYVMFEDWETISQLSRIDLLNKPSNQFIRIVHRPGWKDELRKVLEDNLRKRRIFSNN